MSRRRTELAVTALPILFFALLGLWRRWVCDDAFIDFRVVSNLLAGHGPVFNIGERVEAYSNPLWVGLLAGFGALGLPLEPTAVGLGWVLAIAGLGFGVAASWRLATHDRARAEAPPVFFVPLGACIVAVLPPMWDFSTSGLETGLGFAWLGGVFWALVRCGLAPAAERSDTRPHRARWFWIAAVGIGLGPLVRPDFIVFAVVFAIALVVVVRPPARPRAVWLAAVALALPVAYEIFRMGYFAAIVSNSTLAKEPGLARWSHGWLYLRDFVRPYVLFVPLAAGLAVVAWRVREARRAGDRRRFVLLATPVAAAVLHAGLVVRAGGDFMHARLFLPSLWCVTLAVGVIALPLPARAFAPRGLWLATLTVIAWAVACAGWLRLGYETGRGPTDIADERAFYSWESRKKNPLRVEDFVRMPFGRNGVYLRSLADSLGNGPAGVGERLLVLAVGDRDQRRVLPLAATVPATIRLVVTSRNIGITGYLAGPHVHLVDVHGLADPLAARIPSRGTGRPGHDKQLSPAWVVARFAATPPTHPAGVAARQALERPPLADLVAAVTSPLGPGRFLQNLGLAPRLHRVRIAADPVAPATASD